MAEIRLTVNGQERELDVRPETSLLLALRDELKLKGVRPGCGIGVCGSCSVLADGTELLRTCLTPVEAVAGRAITTPEGLSTPDEMHRVQESFLANQAAQCGYCINGLIMGTIAAEARGETSEPGTVPDWLDEHLCRCGTHVRVLKAIEESARPHERTDCAQDRATAPDDRIAGLATQVSQPCTTPRADRLESWVRLTRAGRFEVLTGKVELGQGIRTALGQIAAGQLGVAVEQVSVCSAATGQAPDEMYTAGSMSIENSGTAIARAAVALRRELLARAAGRLGVDIAELTLADDRVTATSGRVIHLSELAAAGPVVGAITDADQPDWSAIPIGTSPPRRDLVGKLTGTPSYVHDLELPDMLHARALLPPDRDARLAEFDAGGVEQLPGVVELIRDGRLIVVIADREDAAERAVRRLSRHVRWERSTSGVDPDGLWEAMSSAPERDLEVAASAPADRPAGTVTVEASYHQPYQAHASIAPSCAVAHLQDDTLHVWTHSQGIYPLRASLAALLQVTPEALQLTHLDGPGCYGHNLADDAAAFAALAARAIPGIPVRFQFSAEDELAWEPYGSAMFVELGAELDGDGRISHWRQHVLTDTHNTRPDGTADRLAPSWLIEGGAPLTWPGAGYGAGGIRNAVPPYSIASVDAFADHVQGPLRVSALRTLGAYANTFAAESFMDELAEQAGADPLEFRLRHLADERAARVLEEAARMADWRTHVGPSGRGLGLAVAQYKNSKAYVAMAIRVSVDTETARIHVEHVDLACDAGAVITPDGVNNQLQGGLIQGLSRALYERVTFGDSHSLVDGWDAYPILPFSATPTVSIELLDTGEHPPVGVGEASSGPAASALANAIDDAIGLRLRRLPFTPERIRQHLFDIDEAAAARVLI